MIDGYWNPLVTALNFSFGHKAALDKLLLIDFGNFIIIGFSYEGVLFCCL
jgi:hypothetical protein